MSIVAAIPVLLCLLSDIASCQQKTVTVAAKELPNAPEAKSDWQNRAEQEPSEASASVSGVVQDASGAPVVGAEVSLTNASRVRFRSALSGANGEFEFINLPSGSYFVTVSVKGFDTITSRKFVLGAQQAYVVPNIVIAISASRTEVLVRPTEEIATEQIRAKEKQRLLGVIPNFYTSYVWDAAPMTTKQKFSLAAHSAFDPVSLLGVGISAGIEQATNAFSGYGQGASGYAKRFGATFVQERTSIFFSHAVYPSLLHQDPRYFYQGSGSVKSRLAHAVASAFLARSDGGGKKPNYSYVLGVMTSGAISNLYYPPADRGPGLVFTNAAIGLGARVGGNIFREFVFKHVTKNVPGSGKP